MTKSDLILELASVTSLPKNRCEEIVNCVFDSIALELAAGKGIEIRGFGSFSIREYDGYHGRNPKTGDPVEVPPKRLPFFKVGKELKALVNGREGNDED